MPDSLTHMKSSFRLQEVFGSNSAVTKEGLSKLVYLDAVVKEVMRMYPTIGALDRRIDRDIKFGKRLGTITSLCGTSTHNMVGKMDVILNAVLNHRPKAFTFIPQTTSRYQPAAQHSS